MIKKLHGWVKDYLHAAHSHAHTFVVKAPPKHFLGHCVEGKNPIILIPGYLEKWNFLRTIANPLSLRGYPIYVVRNLGYNSSEISSSAELVRELIDENKLRKVIIISHSKGGLIGKFLLSFKNSDGVIEKLITVATPWGGSRAAKLIPHKSARELHPNSPVVRSLENHIEVNHKIVSIYGFFDNHVWPTKSCHLEGAKNIEMNTHGHHTILFSKSVIDIIGEEIDSINEGL